MTRQPICGECSTRYEGVNYSREGLRMLQAQRAAAAARAAGKGAKAVAALAWCLSPLLLYLVYLGYLTAADVLMSLLHREL